LVFCVIVFPNGSPESCRRTRAPARFSLYSVPSLFRGGCAVRLLLHWILTAIAVWIVARVVPGISVSGPTAALIAALVIGLINATLGLLLKILTFPLTLLTLGLFWFVINALMLELAAAFVRGFYVRNFVAAFIGAIVLSVVSSLLQWIFMPSRQAR
jgi:putative membrane protein